MDFLLVMFGLSLLILGGDWLLKAAVSLSLKLSIPRMVIGMTVVSFATSFPELIVSVKSALIGSAGIALGNVIGSNIANLGLVLGITLLISKIQIKKSFYATDWPMLIIASGLFYGFIIYDGVLGFYEGLILFSILIVFLISLFRFQKRAFDDETNGVKNALSLYKTVLFLGFGGVALWGGSELLILGAKNLALSLGVSEAFIGVTVISVGTSIPELAASIVAVIKKEKAISLGNLIGSNIFNILAVLGITSIITPISMRQADQTLLTNDIYWMLGFTFIIFPLAFFKKRLDLGWKEGLILIFGYVLFVLNLFLAL